MTHPIVVEARKWLGCPFRHMARGPRHLDCAGLAIRASRAAGYAANFDLPHYGREPWRDGLRDAVRKNLGEPVTDGPQPGDIVLIRFNVEPHHIAIVGDHPQGLSLIHAFAEAGRVVEHILDANWRAKITEVYRWPAKH